MALPLLPLLKVMLLGLVKIVLLGVGALVMPVYTLRFILTGASGILLPVLDWLEANNRLKPERHQAILEDLAVLGSVEFSRREARHLLFQQIVKSVRNLVLSLRQVPQSVVNWVKRFYAWLRG